MNSRLLKRLPILIFALLSSIGAQAFSQELPFVHYTTESRENPLPSAAVTGVHQDALGFIWFSVFSSGLVRYDGSEMEIYAGEDGLRDLGVYRMIEDAAGRIWVISQGGAVLSGRPLEAYGIGERVRFTGSFHGAPLPSTPIYTNAIAADAQGTVWIGASGTGLLQFRRSGREAEVDTIRLGDAGSMADVTALLPRTDGSLWIGTVDGALFRLASGEVQAEALPLRLEYDDHATVLYETSSGVLLAGTSQGRLLRLHSANGQLTAEPLTEPVGAMITSVIEGPEGSLWLGSEGAGVVRLGPAEGVALHLGESHGLLSRTIHEITIDAEGSLWFAQLGGVSRLRPNFDAFRGFTATSRRGERPALPAPAIGAIAVDDDPNAPCRVWAGTSEAGIACIHGDGTTEYLQSGDGLRSDWVNALLIDEPGDLWIGTLGGIQHLTFDVGRVPAGSSSKTVRIGGRQARLTAIGPDQISVFTTTIERMPLDDSDTTSGRESLWFGGWDLFLRVDGKWYIFGAPSGLPQARLHAVAYDDARHLWVSTQGEGIFRSREPVTLEMLRSADLGAIAIPTPGSAPMQAFVMRDSLFERVAIGPEDAAVDEVYRLLWIDGSLWAATAHGVLAMQPTGVEADSLEVTAHLDRSNGLGAELAMSLMLAPQTGALWTGTNAGLAEIDVKNRSVIRTLTMQDGLVGNEGWYTGSLATGGDGALYYGSARGLSVYRPALDRPNTVLPRVRLRSAQFVTDGGNNEFVARYAALGFAEESRILYRTRLIGYEDEWSPPHADNRIRYTNLPAILFPRTYTLEVLASNSSGAWLREPLRYQFAVPPPPWFQWWAIALYGLTLIVAVVLVHRIQHDRLIRKERERARITEAELRAEAAQARSQMAEAASRALEEENRLKEAELEKARELEQAYHALKVTQAQLIQSEKLASLGQLTAGIAHEIKNPLNFVTNFAVLTRELTNELMTRSEEEPELPLSDIREDLELLQLNSEKIEEHGLRADGIVRAMLEHSRGEAGQRQPTELNAFLEQYATLAYQGERARTADFNVNIERSYDPEVGTIELVQQDVGRVLVNLLDNAFYAVQERAHSADGTYQPTVSVATKALPRWVEITIGDNGTGIPEDVKQKIFEPFFTTKPPGKGTGLGLSLSHNIIVQGCGGEFLVDSAVGEGTTFRIRLPRQA